MIKSLLLVFLLLTTNVSNAAVFSTVTVEGAATFSAGTVNTVPYLNASKVMTSSAVTPTELGYLSGVTSSIQTQLGSKEGSITATTSADYYRGDKTFQPFNAAAQAAVVTQVITNGVTTNAPSEDAVFDALALKAPLASPGLTGNPTAPTQAPGDNSTNIATTAYADAAAISASAGIIASSIVNGDTTHAPDGNSVFDALALKQDIATLFPLKAPTTILANPPSYGFAGGDDDTGIFSTGDGNVSIQANSNLKASFDQNTIDLYATSGATVHGNLDVTGDISANNYPPSGTNMSIAGYSATGDLTSIPNLAYTDYNGLYGTMQIPVSGDLNILSLSSASGVSPANVNGIFINNQAESTTNTTLLDLNNAAPIGDDFAGLRIFNTGDAVDSITMQSVGNSGNYGGQLRLMEASNSGTGAGGILYNIYNSGIQSGQLTIMNIGDSANNTSNVTLLGLNENGNTTGHFQGIGFWMNGDVSGDSTLATFGDYGNVVGGNFTGINLYGGSASTGNSIMLNVGDNGSSINKTGVGISLSGSASNSVNGLYVNVNSVTFAGQKTSGSFTGNLFTTQSDIDTGDFTPTAFTNNNSLGGSLQIDSGAPILANPLFGNNLGIVINFDDDYTADDFISPGNSLGYSINGFVNQVTGATGKTLDTLNYMLAAGSNPSGDGTINNLNFFRVGGLLNAGGSLTAGNIRAFYVDPVFDGAVSSTNKWGFINASSSINWMKGSLILGGTTGLSTGSYILDLIGDSFFNGDLTVSGSAFLGNGSEAVTQSANDNSTKIATTAYVDAAVGGGGAVSSVFGRTGAVVAATSDYDAVQVDNTPAGNIAATNVQSAIDELDTEKQPIGNYITALTGDATASGPGSAALTLATVNSNVGSFGSATQVSSFTVNAKGLITAASNVSIQIAESQVTNLTTDLAAKEDVANKSTSTSLGTSNTLYPSQNAVKVYVDTAVAGITPSAAANISTTTTLSYATAQYYFADPSGGAFTITLPLAASNDGKHFFVMNVDFAGPNTVSVARSGSDLINAATSDSIDSGESKHYVSNGTNWFIIP